MKTFDPPKLICSPRPISALDGDSRWKSNPAPSQIQGHLVTFIDNSVKFHPITVFSSEINSLVNKDNFQIQLTELMQIYDGKNVENLSVFRATMSEVCCLYQRNPHC